MGEAPPQLHYSLRSSLGCLVATTARIEFEILSRWAGRGWMALMTKLDGENHDDCYDLGILGMHRPACKYTESTISWPEHAPTNLPVLKILLHKVA